MPQITREHLDAINEMRDQGFAVIVWTPEEIGSASRDRIEERCIEFGNQVIEDLQ